MTSDALSPDALATLQRDTFGYFLKETDPVTGLVPDNTRSGAPASITAVGLGLATYPIGVERQYLSRAEAAARTLGWVSPPERCTDYCVAEVSRLPWPAGCSSVERSGC